MDDGECRLDIEWHEIVGYIVGFITWLYGKLPSSCDGWTDVFAFLIASITFVFITLPKAWDFQRARWKRAVNNRKKNKK